MGDLIDEKDWSGPLWAMLFGNGPALKISGSKICFQLNH